MHTVGESIVHIADIGYETAKGGYAGIELPSIYEPRNRKSSEEAATQVIEGLTNEPEHIPLIYIEDPFTTQEKRRRIFAHLMDSSLCAGVLFTNGAVTDCFSYGRHAGLMVRLGGKSMQVIPVIDGYSLSGGIQSNCGGRVLTECAISILKRKSEELKTNLLLPHRAIEQKQRVALEQLPVYKEKKDYEHISSEQRESDEVEVAKCFKEAVSFLGHTQPKYYEFPTGFTTRIFSERNEIPEKIFTKEGTKTERLDPFKNHTGATGEMDLIEMIKVVVETVDIEYHDMLLGNIMLSGGGSLISGITERLQLELTKLFPNNRIKVNNEKKEFSTFFGGSILGALGVTNNLMITRGEYSECGASALERKRSEWVR
ncbi:hypothetical protein NEFER03_0866 [Nematocida sp. LUAm3]|nr:hypothetical protein NEFER03_0866 [Nematocida sp. LUAm3]KAI5174884.1 hypothetical protein NEFER02_0984 [Nematocida sp. LUAm2]KAI5177518.1 hypothetical protein NEFER01_0768 [Nematocida sp. LUAm1]